ncbi:MAG: hypothetical protein AAGI66_09295 [Cyanobacteria bacterium P01_H01_bin.74]
MYTQFSPLSSLYNICIALEIKVFAITFTSVFTHRLNKTDYYQKSPALMKLLLQKSPANLLKPKSPVFSGAVLNVGQALADSPNATSRKRKTTVSDALMRTQSQTKEQKKLSTQSLFEQVFGVNILPYSRSTDCDTAATDVSKGDCTDLRQSPATPYRNTVTGSGIPGPVNLITSFIRGKTRQALGSVSRSFYFALQLDKARFKKSVAQLAETINKQDFIDPSKSESAKQVLRHGLEQYIKKSQDLGLIPQKDKKVRDEEIAHLINVYFSPIVTPKDNSVLPYVKNGVNNTTVLAYACVRQGYDWTGPLLLDLIDNQCLDINAAFIDDKTTLLEEALTRRKPTEKPTLFYADTALMTELIQRGARLGKFTDDDDDHQTPLLFMVLNEPNNEVLKLLLNNPNQSANLSTDFQKHDFVKAISYIVFNRVCKTESQLSLFEDNEKLDIEAIQLIIAAAKKRGMQLDYQEIKKGVNDNIRNSLQRDGILVGDNELQIAGYAGGLAIDNDNILTNEALKGRFFEVLDAAAKADQKLTAVKATH